MDYARKLAQIPSLDLKTIFLLDRVQKKQVITSAEAQFLRSQDLIKGKRPNIYISSRVAAKTGQQSDYMKMSGADNTFCREQIINYLRKYESGTREDFNKMLINKLSDILNNHQKNNKIKNILQSLRREGVIDFTPDRKWVLK